MNLETISYRLLYSSIERKFCMSLAAAIPEDLPFISEYVMVYIG